jgi:hypothetical protein
VPESGFIFSELPSLAALPPESLALFEQNGLCSTPQWYLATAAHALPKNTTPAFLVAQRAGQPLAIIPMQRGPGKKLASLTTPYTCLWQPLLSSELLKNPSLIRQLGQSFGAHCHPSALTRLDALDPQSPEFPAFLQGIRDSGLHTLGFDHFTNWHLPLPPGTTWPSYLATRPASLRETIRRRSKHLLAEPGATFTLIDSPTALEPAIADYEHIYASSWKRPEPYPLFNATLMREAAAARMLELGLLHLHSTPIAAQFWIVHNGCATILKLAHAETHRALSPGTVLTALIIENLIERHAITELDFGRGDDPYKKLWTGHRRQRTGILLANPKTLPGVAAIARHTLGKLFRRKSPHSP